MILNFRLDTTTHIDVKQRIVNWSKEFVPHFICAANVHMLMEAHDSDRVREAVENADLVVPDGMPLVWLMRLKGHPSQQRVYGPTLMLHVLEAAVREKIPVGFYGGSPEVLSRLKERMRDRFSGLEIAFSMSPPFVEMSAEEDAQVVDEINRSGARILFVGLGCPKQELWMYDHRKRIKVVMLGVGAAFDFHAGAKPQAPKWIQNIGLEWLFRLISEPRRLWKRYLYHNPRFVYFAAIDLLKYYLRPRNAS